MGFRDKAEHSHHSFAGFVFSAVLRFLQFVLALTVIGLYGQYLNSARLQHKYADPNFVYAVVVGVLAALTSLLYLVPLFVWSKLFGWDVVIFILWVACFGLFGRIFIPADPKGDSAVQMMKNAVWVDLVNMLLWFVSACYGAAMFFTHRGGRSLHTGRAAV